MSQRWRKNIIATSIQYSCNSPPFFPVVAAVSGLLWYLHMRFLKRYFLHPGKVHLRCSGAPWDGLGFFACCSSSSLSGFDDSVLVADSIFTWFALWNLHMRFFWRYFKHPGTIHMRLLGGPLVTGWASASFSVLRWWFIFNGLDFFLGGSSFSSSSRSDSLFRVYHSLRVSVTAFMDWNKEW